MPWLMKRWALGEVIRRAVQVGVDPSQIDPESAAAAGPKGKK